MAEQIDPKSTTITIGCSRRNLEGCMGLLLYMAASYQLAPKPRLPHRYVSKAVTIEFSGTVQQVQDAFPIEMHNYVVNGRRMLPMTVNPAIPMAAFVLW